MSTIHHDEIGELHVTQHALSRFSERMDGNFHARLKAAVPFGAQRGDDLLLRDDDAVFTVAREQETGRRVVTTVLTLDQAVANMQASGIQADLAKAPAQRPSIPMLAARHALAGLGRKARNSAMRDAGYDPEGSAGLLYRAAFDAAKLALSMRLSRIPLAIGKSEG